MLQDSIGRYQSVLTDDGDLMIVGGIIAINNNFNPSATVLLLHVGTEKAAASAKRLWLNKSHHPHHPQYPHYPHHT